MRNKTKLVTGLCLSTALCVGFGLSTLPASAAESYGETWVVSTNATDLTVSNVSAGGVGTISYYTVPEEDIAANSTDDYVYNSVMIPVSNYDASTGYLSIKYDADFDVSEHNVTVWANYAAGTDESGNDYDAGMVLTGWFVNWNVTDGKAIDGYSYKTINVGNYTGSKDITGITLNFSYEGDTTVAKTIKLMGMRFHAKGETPTFVTDPKDPIIEAPVAESGNSVTIGEWADESAGNMAFTKDADGKTVINFPGVPTSKSRIYAAVEGHDYNQFPKVKITYSSTKAFAWYFSVNSTGGGNEIGGYYVNMPAGENVSVTYDLLNTNDQSPITVNKIYVSIDRVGYGAYDEATYADGLGKKITFNIEFVDADGNPPSADGGIAVNGSKEVECAVTNWNTTLADTVVAKIAGFEGMKLSVKVGNAVAYTTTFAGTAEQTIEADLSAYDTVEKVILVFEGEGTVYINDVQLSKKPAISVYSTSNGSYFSTYEEINEGTYQMHMVRNSSSGFVKVEAAVTNYIDTYDVLAVDVSVASGKALIGIMVGDVYLLSHWDSANFMDIGDHQYTYYKFNIANTAWDQKTITLYINPSAATTEGYNYEADIKIGMFFMKSSELAEGSISFAEESYEVDYDGTVKTVEATDANGAAISYKYAIDGKEYDAVANAGTYTVTATSACTRTHLPATATTTLTINKVKANVPEITATVNGNSISFSATSGIEYKMNAEDEWADLVTLSNLAYNTEYTITLRVKENDNLYASDETTLTFTTEKEKAAAPEITATAAGNTITFSATEGIEYKLSADGEWADLATLTDLAYSTEYTIIVRTKATDTLLASDEVTLTATTEADPNAKPDDSSTSETPGTSETPSTSETPNTSDNNGGNSEKNSSGCFGAVGTMGIVGMLAIGVVVVALCKKKKED